MRDERKGEDERGVVLICITKEGDSGRGRFLFLQPEDIEGGLVTVRRSEEPAPVEVEEVVWSELDVAESLEKTQVDFSHFGSGIHQAFRPTRRRETEASAVGDATEESCVVEEGGQGGELGIVDRAVFDGRRTTGKLDGGRGEEEP